MRPISIESENLVIRDTGDNITAIVRGRPTAILFLWQVVTDAVLDLKEVKPIMLEFMSMNPRERKQAIQLLYKAYRMGNNEPEIARILDELIRGDD